MADSRSCSGDDSEAEREAFFRALDEHQGRHLWSRADSGAEEETPFGDPAGGVREATPWPGEADGVIYRPHGSLLQSSFAPPDGHASFCEPLPQAPATPLPTPPPRHATPLSRQSAEAGGWLTPRLPSGARSRAVGASALPHSPGSDSAALELELARPL